MSLLMALLTLTGTAYGANVNIGPGDSIVAEINNLGGNGPHTATITSGGRYVETSRLDVGAADITIIGTGYTDTIWMFDGVESEMITVGTGGSLRLVDITLDGSDPLHSGEVCDDGIDNDSDGLVDCADPNCDFACGVAEKDTCNLNANRSAIVATNAVDVTVDRSQLRCFWSVTSGGALRAIQTDVTITDSYFWQNFAIWDGGHVYIQDGATFESTGTEYTYGTASFGSGGAIYTTQTAVTIVGNYIRNNDSSVRGGGIFASANTDNLTVHSNIMQQNMSLAVFEFNLNANAVDTAGNEVNNTFAIFYGEGGGAFLDGQSVDYWDNLMCGNISDMGAGLALDDPEDVTIQNNTFNENYALHYGGGLYVYAGPNTSDPFVVNNTFLGNSAGKNPPDYIPEIYVFGGGGAIMLDGTLSDFRNNIVAYTEFGGGISGLDGDNYTIGDPIAMDHNIFYRNCETNGCGDDPDDWLHLVGDYANHALSPTNYEFDPYPTYYGGVDLDCYPDAFYTTFESVAVDNGDPALVDVGGSVSDIGAFGGPRANVKDEDGDGYENIYDCDDTDPGGAEVHPNANDECDFVDNDCDGEIDEGSVNSWWEDADGDGFGDATHFVPDALLCADGGMGPNNQNGPGVMASNNLDCDDTNADIHPDADEVCDDQDNDCNDVIDDEEVLIFKVYHPDVDGDGYGSEAASQTDCAPPDGYVEDPSDCDDDDEFVNPGAVEVCDGADTNCDGLIDNDASGATVYYLDQDGDGYGTDESLVSSCDTPGAEFIPDQGGDCNDDPDDTFAIQINPGAAEICDGIDNNCDGAIDVGVQAPAGELYSIDADGDGFGDGKTVTRDCEQPPGYIVHGKDDCDDNNATIGQCPECGCQTTSPRVPYSLLLLVGGLMMIRRRVRQD